MDTHQPTRELEGHGHVPTVEQAIIREHSRATFFVSDVNAAVDEIECRYAEGHNVMQFLRHVAAKLTIRANELEREGIEPKGGFEASVPRSMQRPDLLTVAGRMKEAATGVTLSEAGRRAAEAFGQTPSVDEERGIREARKAGRAKQ